MHNRMQKLKLKIELTLKILLLSTAPALLSILALPPTVVAFAAKLVAAVYKRISLMLPPTMISLFV
jgi:hypothetical protein